MERVLIIAGEKTPPLLFYSHSATWKDLTLTIQCCP